MTKQFAKIMVLLLGGSVRVEETIVDMKNLPVKS